MVALVRVMPRHQYGAFALSLAVVSIVRVFAAFGLNNASARILSAAEVQLGDASVRVALIAALRFATRVALLATPCYGALVLIADHISALRASALPLLALLPAVLVTPYSEALMGFLRATHQPRLVTLMTVAGAVLSAAVTITLLLVSVTSAAPIAAAQCAGTLSTAAGLALAVHAASRRRPPRPREPAVTWQAFLHYGGAIMLTALTTTAIAYLDVVVLGIDRGSSSVAYYAPASSVATVILGVPAIIGTYFLPVLTRATVMKDSVHIHDLFHWASRWNLALTAPALTVLVACPTSAMRLLFGSSYAISGGALRVLGIGAALQVAFGFNGLTLEAHGVPSIVARRELVTLGVSCAACVTLIPPLGIVGAAWATTAGLVFSNLACSQVLLTRFRVRPYDGAMVATICGFAAAAGLSGLAAAVLHNDVASVATAGLLGLLTAVVAFVVSDAADKASVRQYGLAMLRRILRSAPHA
jgi:O-antigen/teichoic acid export membrane protein